LSDVHCNRSRSKGTFCFKCIEGVEAEAEEEEEAQTIIISAFCFVSTLNENDKASGLERPRQNVFLVWSRVAAITRQSIAQPFDSSRLISISASAKGRLCCVQFAKHAGRDRQTVKRDMGDSVAANERVQAN
jgi:hypothetical protein